MFKSLLEFRSINLVSVFWAINCALFYLGGAVIREFGLKKINKVRNISLVIASFFVFLDMII